MMYRAYSLLRAYQGYPLPLRAISSREFELVDGSPIALIVQELVWDYGLPKTLRAVSWRDKGLLSWRGRSYYIPCSRGVLTVLFAEPCPRIVSSGCSVEVGEKRLGLLWRAELSRNGELEVRILAADKASEEMVREVCVHRKLLYEKLCSSIASSVDVVEEVRETELNIVKRLYEAKKPEVQRDICYLYNVLAACRSRDGGVSALFPDLYAVHYDGRGFKPVLAGDDVLFEASDVLVLPRFKGVEKLDEPGAAVPIYIGEELVVFRLWRRLLDEERKLARSAALLACMGAVDPEKAVSRIRRIIAVA